MHIRHLRGHISFKGASIQLDNPDNTWILYFIGPIKYDTLKKIHTIHTSFLPTSFFEELKTPCFTQAEIVRNEVSFDIPSRYANDLVIGNQYDSNGYSYRQNNIFDANRLQLAIHNAHLLPAKCLRHEKINYYDNVVANKIKATESRFLYYKCCNTGKLVLIPCYEVARYFFFTENIIVDRILDGTLHFENSRKSYKILNEYFIEVQAVERNIFWAKC